MKTLDSKRSKDLRRQRNSDVIRRMRGGEPLTSFDSKASWFPPRPTIKKDRKEIARLYDSKPVLEISREPLRGDDGGKIVRLTPAAVHVRTNFDEAG